MPGSSFACVFCFNVAIAIDTPVLNGPQCPQWILLVAAITIAVVGGRHSPVIYGALWCPCCITGPGEVMMSFLSAKNSILTLFLAISIWPVRLSQSRVFNRGCVWLPSPWL